MTARKIVTHERLVNLLDYDPDTGFFTWKVDRSNFKAGTPAGCKHSSGYIVLRIDGRLYFAHRLAWFYVYKVWPKEELDHEGGRRDDNRIAKLREATHSQNMQNRPVLSHSSTGLKGVSRSRGKFKADIRVDGHRKYLGTFGTPEEAAQAYARAAREHHGEFARA